MSAKALCTAATAAVAAATLLGVAAAPAQAASGESYRVPAGGTFTAVGHGYGHGHGMSQYGAQGAAVKGLSAAQILAFYYPGTRMATRRQQIRVLITADTTRDTEVVAEPGLSVTDRGTGRSYALPQISGVRHWRLNVDRRGRTVIGYQTGHWHRYRPGGLAHLVGDGELRAADGTLGLVLPGGTTVTYRGRLRGVSPSPGSSDRDTVDVLPLEQYLRGVVSAEMPASWRPAALQAQAVAARTYAIRESRDNAHRAYQICDSWACQVYGGVAAEYPSTDAAVRATRGQYLIYDGRPAFTQFGSSSGGWTTDGGLPYLPAQADPYDGWAGNPVHSWSTRLDARVAEQRYPAIGRLRRILVTARDGNGAYGGRVTSVVLVGSTGRQPVSGAGFEALYGLRSTWFDFS
ncbi:MAG TPA: SpoIID/LytB domain-containing protein [Marmoricola sp.]